MDKIDKIERRSSLDRRSGIDRHSGKDTRLAEQQDAQGERRSGNKNRSTVDRRK
jgi:hypothetical protein